MAAARRASLKYSMDNKKFSPRNIMINNSKSISSRPLISIVVPIFKVEEYIEKCIASIVKNCANNPNYELILVNDGTPDQSANIAYELTKNLSNVRIIHQKNFGLGAARNVGASASLGDYLWFIDSDDWIPEDAIDNVTKALLTYSPDALNIAFETSLNSGMGFKNSAIPNHIYSGIEYLDIAIVQNPVQYYLIRRSFYKSENLSFKTGIYHEDALFTPMAISKANSVIFLNKVCYIYNIRENSITTSADNIRKRACDVLSVFEELMIYSLSNVGGDSSSRVIGKYAGIALGGVFYYYKKLSKSDRRNLISRVSFINTICFLLKKCRAKYVLVFIYMYIDTKLNSMLVKEYYSN